MNYVSVCSLKYAVVSCCHHVIWYDPSNAVVGSHRESFCRFYVWAHVIVQMWTCLLILLLWSSQLHFAISMSFLWCSVVNMTFLNCARCGMWRFNVLLFYYTFGCGVVVWYCTFTAAVRSCRNVYVVAILTIRVSPAVCGVVWHHIVVLLCVWIQWECDVLLA